MGVPNAARRAFALVAVLLGTVVTIALSSVSAMAATPVTLQVWTWLDQGARAPWYNKIAADFHSRHPNVTIQYVPVPDATITPKLLAAAGTHTGPDVVIADRGGDTPDLFKDGVYANLTPYWKAFAAKDQFPAGAVDGLNGKVYAVNSDPTLVAIYYNKSILDRYKLKPPKTISEIIKDAQTITSKGQYKGISTSFITGGAGDYELEPWLQSQGVNYCNINTAKGRQVFTQLGNWVAKGYFSRESAAWNQAVNFNQFLTGDYAFSENGANDLPTAKSGAKFPWGVVRFPSGSAGSKVFVNGELAGIGGFSSHKQLAWEFINQEMLSKQGQESSVEIGGGIPVRLDVSKLESKKTPGLAPFTAALQSPAQRPGNSNELQVNNALGAVWSSVVAGSISPSAGAVKAGQAVQAALRVGGGACEPMWD